MFKPFCLDESKTRYRKNPGHSKLSHKILGFYNHHYLKSKIISTFEKILKFSKFWLLKTGTVILEVGFFKKVLFIWKFHSETIKTTVLHAWDFWSFAFIYDNITYLNLLFGTFWFTVQSLNKISEKFKNQFVGEYILLHYCNNSKSRCISRFWEIDQFRKY